MSKPFIFCSLMVVFTKLMCALGTQLLTAIGRIKAAKTGRAEVLHQFHWIQCNCVNGNFLLDNFFLDMALCRCDFF